MRDRLCRLGHLRLLLGVGGHLIRTGREEISDIKGCLRRLHGHPLSKRARHLPHPPLPTPTQQPLTQQRPLLLSLSPRRLLLPLTPS